MCMGVVAWCHGGGGGVGLLGEGSCLVRKRGCFTHLKFCMSFL